MMKLSARNMIKGRVVDVTRGTTTAHVRIDVGGGTVITASITNEAVDDLKLTCGDTAHAAIKSVDRDLERAAYTLGRPEWRTALEVTLPLARNGILAGLVLAFARALGEFGATLMLAGNIPGKTATVPLAIYSAVQTGETGDALLLVGLLTALSCVVLVVAGRLGARAA